VAVIAVAEGDEKESVTPYKNQIHITISIHSTKAHRGKYVRGGHGGWIRMGGNDVG
jgi:hypothetical protein